MTGSNPAIVGVSAASTSKTKKSEPDEPPARHLGEDSGQDLEDQLGSLRRVHSVTEDEREDRQC